MYYIKESFMLTTELQQLQLCKTPLIAWKW